MVPNISELSNGWYNNLVRLKSLRWVLNISNEIETCWVLTEPLHAVSNSIVMQDTIKASQQIYFMFNSSTDLMFVF